MSAAKRQLLELPTVASCADFVCLDYEAKLKKHKNWPRGAKNRDAYTVRTTASLELVVVHHSAGQILPPPAGINATNNYIVNHRGWPRVPYHWYVPYRPLMLDGRPIIYQLNHPRWRTWHTKGANTKGAAVLFQGYFDAKNEPSDIQKQICGSVLHWTLRSVGLHADALRTHSDFTKPNCPGPWLEGWVKEERGRTA